MKTVNIPVQLFKNNRKNLVPLLNKDSLVILHSNDEMSRTADQNYPYRQNSDLFYFCGINQEETILLLAPDHPDEKLREVLFIRKADKNLETWEGHKLTAEEARQISGIKEIKTTDDFNSVLAGMMLYAQHVYINTSEHQKFIPELPSRDHRFAADLQKKFPAHSYQRLAPLMRRLRTVKSVWETALIREACKITREAFFRVLRWIKPGVFEYEVEAEITHEFIRRGAKGHAFPPIMASGANACTLHYVTNHKQCSEGELLLMDFGAEYGNFAADCSRTIPVNGRYTERQREIYLSVLEVFEYARSLMMPGTTINEVHARVCSRFSDEHVKLGLYTREELEAQNPAAPLYQQYYMHGTSHFMGLDVHDLGEKDREFIPGMVLTCEPGIYIPEESLGIRLENDILITEDGNQDLMSDIPLHPDELEKIMQ